MSELVPFIPDTFDQDAMVRAIEIAAPPERVFRALTDPAQLIRWWGDDTCRASSNRHLPPRRLSISQRLAQIKSFAQAVM